MHEEFGDGDCDELDDLLWTEFYYSCPIIIQWSAPNLRLAYVTSLQIERKQTPQMLLSQRATKYCCYKIMFIVWTLYVYSSAILPASLIPLPLTSSGRGAHSFISTVAVSFFVLICAGFHSLQIQIYYSKANEHSEYPYTGY